jgi:hypothetical protein
MSIDVDLWELPEGWVWSEFQHVAEVASNPGLFLVSQ